MMGLRSFREAKNRLRLGLGVDDAVCVWMEMGLSYSAYGEELPSSFPLNNQNIEYSNGPCELGP